MTNLVFVRDPYNYDRDAVSRETGMDFSDDPSMTQQNMAAETDINVLVERFAAGVPLPEAPPFSDVDVTAMQMSYQDAMNLVVDARERFYELPSAVRERFHNDPHRLLEFVSSEANRDEAVRLGIVNAPPPPVVPDPPTPAE